MAGIRRGKAPYDIFAGWTVRKLWAKIGRQRIVAPNNAQVTLVRLLVLDTVRVTAKHNTGRATQGHHAATLSDGQAGGSLLASANDDSDKTPAPQVQDVQEYDKVAYLQRTVDTLQSCFVELYHVVTESLQDKTSKSLSGTESMESRAGDNRLQVL